MDLLKLISIAILISITVVVVKQIKPELAISVIIAGSVVLLTYILLGLTDVLSFFNSIIERTGINSQLFSIVVKIIAAGYLVEFAHDICIDSGNNAIADKVVLGGKIIIFLMSLPIISALFEVVLGLVQM